MGQDRRSSKKNAPYRNVITEAILSFQKCGEARKRERTCILVGVLCMELNTQSMLLGIGFLEIVCQKKR